MSRFPDGVVTVLVKLFTEMQKLLFMFEFKSLPVLNFPKLLMLGLLLQLVSYPALLLAQEPKLKILIFGDSLSAAYNIPIELSWPILFEKKLQLISPGSMVINASISGETSFGGLQRLDALLQKHQPSHLILELGGNDGLQGLKFKQSAKNLIHMIEQAEAIGARVLMIGVRLPPNLGPVYNQRFQQMYEDVAAQTQVSYLPKFLLDIAGNNKLMQADGIHPTVQAQPKLSDRVFQKMIYPGITDSADSCKE